MTKDRSIAMVAGVVAVGAIVAFVVDHNDLASKIKSDHRAVASAKAQQTKAEKKAKATKSKTVTRIVSDPVFGRSTLLGIYASGMIQAGGMGDESADAYTADDANCSTQYQNITEDNTINIDRDEFMAACETNVMQTAKTDNKT